MRSDAAEFSMVAPSTLAEVLAMLAAEPGAHTAMAGGTELMVALNTGRLTQRSFVSIQGVEELRFIRCDETAITIGAGATFTDIRNSREIAEALPLLAEAAAWTGTVANQNRATLGGNVCNASPAADSPPVLLAYDATVTMVSAAGERTLSYGEFHLGYKRTALRPDQLLHSITVPRPALGSRQYLRKVGTRQALAISKVALAAVARLEGTTLDALRLGAASLADRPLRCEAAERALAGRSLAPGHLEATIRAGRAALATEVAPIDDIRSTAKYRAAAAGNLLEQFLRSL